MRRPSLRRDRSSTAASIAAAGASLPSAGASSTLRRSPSLRSASADGAADFDPSSTAAGAAATDPSFQEEVDAIKRYEDFTTIDWVQDAAREQLRRRQRRFEIAKQRRSSLTGGVLWQLRQKIWELYDAGQAWIVVTLVGAAIGLNAAFLSIVTEWLSDVKLGFCTTGFYLNDSFCCWGAEEDCDEWHRWSSIWPINYFLYFIFAILFSFTSAVLVKAFAPYAAGSGISEIKCIIAGFVMKGFLGFWTWLIKSIALPLAIASGLSVGKEGPSVHFAVCTGNIISRWFTKYKRNAAKTREILSASAAAGVAVAFGSPIGGVLFSLEEMSSYFPLKTMWRSYFCALVATAVLAAMNPFRTGQLVMFEVHYDRSWHLFEIIFFIFLGIFGGLYGAFVIKWNLRVQAFRKKYLTPYAVPEAVILAAITAILCYPNMFLRIDMTENMEILFLECEGTNDYNGICEARNRWIMVFSLLFATVMRTLLVIISYGCKVPAGIFVPSMAIGASFGRMVGILVQALHESFPHSRFFSSCGPDLPCITPGTYAFLGAGAALSGIMHITVSVVVIMFELTGALTYILPTMIVVGTTKAVSAYFPPGGIADRMITFSGYPYLDTKEEHTFNVPVSTAMTPASAITSLPAKGMTIGTLTRLLEKTNFSGFPVVTDNTSRLLLGYIGRTELRYAISKAQASRTLALDSKCTFTPPEADSQSWGKTTGVPGPSSRREPLAPDGPSSSATAANALAISPTSDGPSSSFSPPALSAQIDSSQRSREMLTPMSPTTIPAFPSSQQSRPAVTFDGIARATATAQVDFSRFVDPTPLTVHPRLPLETTLQVFQKMGPRVILVESKGRLAGLITVKDSLKYQSRVEARAHGQHVSSQNSSTNGFRSGIHSSPNHGRVSPDILEERLWYLLSTAGSWVGNRLTHWTNGRIRLHSTDDRSGLHRQDRSLQDTNVDEHNGRGSDSVDLTGEGTGLLVGASADPRDGRHAILDDNDDYDPDNGPDNDREAQQ